MLLTLMLMLMPLLRFPWPYSRAGGEADGIKEVDMAADDQDRTPGSSSNGSGTSAADAPAIDEAGHGSIGRDGGSGAAARGAGRWSGGSAAGEDRGGGGAGGRPGVEEEEDGEEGDGDGGGAPAAVMSSRWTTADPAGV